ncbi:MAG: hypothetical protein NT085_00845 [candidate division SR1 bacterium]|nr:hypothetical protein [candidate division SR1 bacterium]
MVVCFITLTGFGFTNLTGLNQDLYRNNASETAQHLLSAIQNPTASLKLGNIISIWNMDLDVENSFAKGYCTYGAARISPEFFPFIDEQTQQRTWGGNAVDRCKNAYDTGYKIGMAPSQGALVVYNAGGKFGSYGHVGKVLHYDRTLKKIIVRDMARVGRGQMSDRREDLTTANVECYIYNSRTTIPTDQMVTSGDSTLPIIHTGTNSIIPQILPPVISPKPVVNVPIINTPTIPEVVIPTIIVPTQPTTPIVPTTPVVIPTTPTIPEVVIPNIPTAISQNSLYKKLVLTFENLSDIATHFMTQNDLVATLVSKSPLKLGEVATLTLEIKDKDGNPYSGLLPFSFTILSTNDSLQTDISNIQMINNGSVDISILGQKIGIATIVISIDDTKIGEFNLEVK